MRYIAILLGLAAHLTIIATDLYAQEVSADTLTRPMELSTRVHTEARLQADLAALQQYRDECREAAPDFAHVTNLSVLAAHLYYSGWSHRLRQCRGWTAASEFSGKR